MKIQEKLPVITILLPFFRVGKEFDQAIESIINQTFRHWKLLLISNNGNQEGLEIAINRMKEDSRIKLIHEQQQGIAHALNAGLQLCKTPYVARMDADDFSHPERLQKQFDYLQKNKDVDVVSSQTIFSSSIPGSEGFSIFVDWQNNIIAPEEHDLYRFIESPLAHPTIMFRRELIDKYGLYNTGPVPEDYEMWLRWMDQGVRFYKIPEPLLTWNDHSGRLTRTHDNYSRESFYNVKVMYLSKWIRRHVPAEKRIVVCGSSPNGRKRSALLQENGVVIFGFTDVKKRSIHKVRFIGIEEITEPEKWFLINVITSRGVGEAIRKHFSALGFKEGRDFILAG
ncbi:MAG: glycosyltransferase [Bacteroidales bacterium]